MAGQGLGRQWGQRRGQGQGTWLSDQLPIENVGEGTLNTVVDGAPAAENIYTWASNIYVTVRFNLNDTPVTVTFGT